MAKTSSKKITPGVLGEMSVPQLSELMARLPEDRVEQLFEALWDLATGHRQFVTGKKPPAGSVGEPDAAWISGLEGYVYTIRPDSAAIKLLLEHNVGRPATKSIAPQDQHIQVLHCVPGKSDWMANEKGEMIQIGGPDEPMPDTKLIEIETQYDPRRDVEFRIPDTSFGDR